jgi:hypothetical protein
VVAAAFVVVGASLMTMVGLFAKAISSSGEMREEFLNLQASSVQSAYGFGWMWNSLRASTGAATQMQAAIDKVSGSSARSRAELAGYAATLYQAWFRGKQLDKALQAVSTVASATDGKLTDQAVNYMKQLRWMGLSVDAIADRIEKKFGGVAREKALSLDKQMMRLGQNLKWIFGGADIAPLLRALDSVLRLFNSNTDSAKSMREAVTAMTEKAIGMILRLGIVLLKSYIWLREHDKTWRALKIGVIMAAVAVALVSIGIVALTGIVFALVGALIAVNAALTIGLVSGLDRARAKLSEFADIGRDMITGLASGIRDAADTVWQALSSVVGGAIGRARKLLDAHSDSRVGISIGRDFGHGFGVGIEREHGTVQQATTGMVRASTGSATAPTGMVRASTGSATAPTGIRGSGKPPVEFNNCNFFGDITEDKLRQMMAHIFEGELWGAPGGATA